jgi:uncharacterized membrane protein YfbV (UPF0208 family)
MTEELQLLMSREEVEKYLNSFREKMGYTKIFPLLLKLRIYPMTKRIIKKTITIMAIIMIITIIPFK